MRSSAFVSGPPKSKGLPDLFENPYFVNAVRLFVVIILALGGYIWKTEMDHLNSGLDEIKRSVSESNRRQWEETSELRSMVSEINTEVGRFLYQTNQVLFEVLNSLEARKRMKSPLETSRSNRNNRAP